jgi:hypothetical protein
MQRQWLAGAMMALLLCGCGGDAPEPDRSSQLVGSWVLAGQECSSETGVTYRADGSWVSLHAAGTWRLRGRHLWQEIRSRRKTAVEGAMEPVDPPDRGMGTVRWQGRNGFMVGWRPGKPLKMARCPLASAAAPK